MAEIRWPRHRIRRIAAMTSGNWPNPQGRGEGFRDLRGLAERPGSAHDLTAMGLRPPKKGPRVEAFSCNCSRPRGGFGAAIARSGWQWRGAGGGVRVTLGL